MRHHSPIRTLVVGIVVLILTSCSGGDDAGSTEPADAASTVAITAGDMFFEPEQLSTAAGTIAI